ncbi:hypothetical protein [Streptomyces sp. NPDC048272]|uniref:hypothetical protein n=1 Tax=Streptomyces sp. NPDC048272 TaxID=3154616 RepID=UPI003444A132
MTSHLTHTSVPTTVGFSVSDIAHATALLLGDDWTAEPGPWNVSGTIFGPYITAFQFAVDHEGDLVIVYDANYIDDALPENPELPEGIRAYGEGIFHYLAGPEDGLDKLAQQSAKAIRAITAR